MAPNRTYQALVAAEVRAEMARQDVTAQAIAARTRISPATLSRRLNGTTPFTIAELACVADALGIDPRNLLPLRTIEAVAS